MKTNNFIVSDKQIELDLNLVPYDLWATKVHVLMLHKENIINKKVAVNIISALVEIGKELDQGKFIIDPNKGLHLTLEAKVVEKIGDDGYFMHTGRSRNDQVMTCELLYLKEKLLELLKLLSNAQKVLIILATEHINTVMPGYTHMQPAKPTTLGQWLLSYQDMFNKCFDTLIYMYDKYNLCPLGAVESYGTSWSIDRIYTAELLGFHDVWEIPQEAISSRGLPQLAYIFGLKNIAITLSKIAADLLLFSTFEYGYITLSNTIAQQMGFVTGSSIMPQKKNPDVLELIRSISSQVIGYESIVSNLLSGLPMGYNRDTREVKEYIESGFTQVGNALICLTEVLKTMIVNKDKMLNSVLSNYSLATDLSDYISQKSRIPYRKVYKIVGLAVKEIITKNILITHLTAKDLKRFGKKMEVNIPLTDIELKNILNPLTVVLKRKNIGGASFTVMKGIIDKRKKINSVQTDWIIQSSEKINHAKKKTETAINKIFI